MAIDSNIVDRMQNTLMNPQGTFETAVHDKAFATESFSQQEAQLFGQQLNSLLTAPSGNVFAQVMEDRSSTLSRAASHAKSELDGKIFGGINAGDNEIGFSPIRPGHVRTDPATGDPATDWYFEPDTAGWNDWIGDGGANNFSVSEDQVVVILGFADQDTSTEVSAINVEEFGRNMDMLPHDMNNLKLKDNETNQQLLEMPTLIASDNDDIHIRLKHDRAVESQPRPFGFTFGLGSFLNNEEYV